MKFPLDSAKYSPDPRSQPIRLGIPDGRYVYVLDGQDVIWIVPDDRPHLHPKVLGHGLPAKYAGDLTVNTGRIHDLTNCSGTFQFDDAEGLQIVVSLLRQYGWEIEPGGVKLFSHAHVARPVVLE